MKKRFFLGVFQITFFVMNAQDTIVFKNKAIESTKIIEVGTEQIKYKRFNNIEGPMYTVNKNDISFIKYKNGLVDTISSSQLPAHSVSFEPVHKNNSDNKLDIYNNKISYQGRYIKSRKLLFLIQDYPNQTVKNQLEVNIDQIISLEKKNKLVMPLTLGIGLGVPAIGLAWEVLSELGGTTELPFLVGCVGVGTVFFISGATILKINKKKLSGKRAQLVKLYNESL